MVLTALILVGGFGTRLRPLSFSTPKPLVEFVNKPIVLHQIEALAAAGVKRIVLAVNYKPKILETALSACAERLGIEIFFSLEDEPLGTGGPIALAAKYLDPEDSDPFFMLNADVSCGYPFVELLKFHQAHGREGTILVTKVDDPSKYGVVVEVPESGGQIDSFKEKPKHFVGDKINAGMYIFNKEVIKRVPVGVKTSIERKIFPAMAAEGQLFRMVLPGYWMDIGQPADYLIGQVLHLNHIHINEPKRLAEGEAFIGNNIVDASAKIGENCQIGPDVVIGPNVVIGNGVRLRRCAIFKGGVVGDGAMIADSIIGWDSRIGKWARLQETCVLGQDVSVPSECFLRGVRVCPHKGVKKSEFQPVNVL